MTDPTASPNAFESDKPGTNARTQAEAAIEDLRRRGGIFVEAVRATRMAMALTDPTLPGNPIVFANQSFLDLTGYSMEETLGQQPYFMNGPDTDPRDAERFRRILERDQDGVVETVQYAKDGRRFVATVLLSAFKDDDGRTIHHFLSWADVTRRVDAEEEVGDLRAAQAALRQSEEKFRNLFESMDEAYAVVELLEDGNGGWADFRFVDANPAFVEHTSMPHPVGKTATELLGRPNPRWAELYGEVLDTGRPMRVVETEPTLGRTFDLNIFRLDRERNRVAILFTDITARRQADEALRESERLRTAMLEVLPLGLCLMDLDGKVLLSNPEWSRFVPTGRVPSRDPEGGKNWRSWDASGRLVAPEDYPGARALRGEHVVPPMEFLYTNEEGKELWTSVAAVPLVDARGEVTGAVAVIQDIDAAKRAEARQATLLAELQHRVRNILAMIRSVARRTAETAGSVEDYAQHLEGRISAMARTQALLTRDVGAAVDLQNLILDELETQAAQPERYRVDGPDIALPPKAAEVLGLAVHELATNSVKYGALSEKGARLDLSWELLEGGEAPRLRLVWAETGVAIAGEPGRAGFGTELITRRVPYELQGSGTMEFEPTGLVATIEFPLAGRPSILQTDEGIGDVR